MTEPTSLPPKRRPIWQTFSPCVTQLAGTCTPAHHRTRGWNSVYRDAGVKATHVPRLVAKEKASRRAPALPIWRCYSAQAFLAGSFLRLQRVDHQEAGGEAKVYASQSGEARPGGFAGGMALEQLSLLFLGRSRAGASECGLDGNFVSESRG